MNKINIDKNITPNDKVTFQVTMEFYGYDATRQFEFIAPRACPQLNKLNNVYLNTKQLGDVKVASKPYEFSKYVKGTKLDSKTYRLKILMNNKKNANELKPGEKVKLTSSDAKLSALNNKEFIIVKPDNNSNERYVHLKVSNSFTPTVASASVTGTLTESSVTVKQKRLKVTPPESVFKGLVKKVVIGSPKKGDVDDIVIYAYKRYSGKYSASIKRKLMANDDDVSEKRPPLRSVIDNFYRKAPSFSKDFKLDGDNTIICYISVARYVYNGKEWVGEWLQVNKLDQAIWARAVPKESN